jgi:hydroxyethylthiazole kinase-like uncharacterized protein yjeF
VSHEPVPIAPPRLHRRDPDAHKGTSGHVLVTGGSVGMSGAPRLAAAAALRVGAGLVTVAVPDPIRSEVATSDPTLLVKGLPSTTTGGVAWPAIAALRTLARDRDVLLVGPGLGLHQATLALVRALADIRCPQVVDADALAAWSGVRIPTREDRIFTPHPGEAARLLGTSAMAVQGDRVAALRALHELLGGVVLLKGRTTLLTDGNRLLINPTGNPGLATGGTGDILAGMIAGLLAEGMAPLEATAAAAYLHGRTSDDLLPRLGHRAQDPQAILDQLPHTVRRHER